MDSRPPRTQSAPHLDFRHQNLKAHRLYQIVDRARAECPDLFNLFRAIAQEGDDECIRTESVNALVHGVPIDACEIDREKHYAPYAVVGQRKQRLQPGVPSVMDGDSEPVGLESGPNHP